MYISDLNVSFCILIVLYIAVSKKHYFTKKKTMIDEIHKKKTKVIVKMYIKENSQTWKSENVCRSIILKVVTPIASDENVFVCHH